MKDLLEVLHRVNELQRHRQPAVLATILRVAGSTYRRPGARMVVEPDGTITGMVSGGCLEHDIVEHCKKVLAEGTPRLLHYDTMAEDEAVWGLGSGCNGKIDVLLEPLPFPEGTFSYVKEMETVMEKHDPGYLWTVIEAPEGSSLSVGNHVWQAPDGRLSSDIPDEKWVNKIAAQTEIPARSHYAHHLINTPQGQVEVLLERIAPPPHLLLFGAGKDAEPVVAFAAALGWRVDVLDHRPAYARPERFPGARRVERVDYQQYLTANPPHPNDIVLIMTHLYLHDKTILTHLVQRPPAYVGVLGPKRRTQQILDELTRAQIPFHSELQERLYSPIGLDIGAESPDEIALSILSEIIAVFRGRDGGKLRNRKGPIHV